MEEIIIKKCEECGEKFEDMSHTRLRKYCTQGCAKIANLKQAKKRYEENREACLKYDKERRQKNREAFLERVKKWQKKNADYIQRKRKAIRLIGNSLREEPNDKRKYVWDRVGKWAKKFDWCQECGSDMYKHKAGGLCAYCYPKKVSAKYREEHRAELRENTRIWYENNRDRKNARDRQNYELVRKVLTGEIQPTQEVKALLHQLTEKDKEEVAKFG